MRTDWGLCPHGRKTELLIYSTMWTCQGVASVLRSQNGTACPSCCQEGRADPRFDPRAITLTPYACWVCLWFFTLYRGLLFFLVSLPFSIHKIQHSNFHFTWKLTLQHYILSGSSGWEHTQCGCPQPNAIFLRFVFGEFPWPSASDSTTCMFSWRSISTNKFWNVVVSECV